ncbi:unnamed protein product [Peronospora belbahrii]|uniref:Protein kinase domain-containing protein n=1 Tax=Peronospora belbahrii TaxID=622444 RepID=A0AAU9KYB2_9STRA|nr:unnamed protein product [Peronospora belbahrii]
MSLTPSPSSQERLETLQDTLDDCSGREIFYESIDTSFSASQVVCTAVSSTTAAPEQFLPPMSFLRRVTSATALNNRSQNEERDKRKEIERKELLEMILESIANVPKAVEKIHTNEKLRQALHEEMGNGNILLHRFFDSRELVALQNGARLDEKRLEDTLQCQELRKQAVGENEEDRKENHLSDHSLVVHDSYDGVQVDDKDLNCEDSEDSSNSDFGAEYENDLVESVNQLCMTNQTLTTMNDMISEPIGIACTNGLSARTSTSPQSSFGMGASPGTTSMDGEPVSALWPRQPDQFAFTQEEDNNIRAEDEVYSEMVSSICEDDTFQDDVNGDEEDVEGEDLDDESEEKVFQMDDEDDVGDDSNGREKELDNGIVHCSHEESLVGAFVVGSPIQGQVTTFQNDLDGKTKQKADTVQTIDIKDGDDVCDDAAGSESSESDDGEPKEYEVFKLRIIREKNRTGFEPNQDWRPRAGTVIGNRYKVEMAIGEAVFSRTYKCIDATTDEVVCLKIIKNNKEYFDQGVDEIRVLEYIDHNCKVDERHLIRLLDAFYFREHLIIVTELLRDNLYEFSRLLLQRGVINYFSIPRLKKIAIEVLEALDTLHSMGIVHCDLKPENILIQNFSACTIKVIDFGSACFTTDELTSYVQSRSYRAPEVILGLLYDTKIDLWSLGCVIAEMYTGEVLFRNDSEQTLLARILATIGPIPASLLADRDELQHQLIETGLFALDHLGNGMLTATLHLPSLEQAVQTKDAEFLDFLRALLHIDPIHRLSAQEALTHPWLQHGNGLCYISQEMQYQVEELCLEEENDDDDDVEKTMKRRCSRSNNVASLSGREADDGEENEKLMRATTSDGIEFYTSHKWAEYYPNQEVAVVTNIGRQPPIPPKGYIPLRYGHRRDLQHPKTSMLCEDDDMAKGFSVDTLLWSDKFMTLRAAEDTYLDQRHM